MVSVKLARSLTFSSHEFMSSHCDISLICRDKKIVSANRAFLCGQSKVLADLLYVDHAQGQGHMYFVTLADVEARHLEGVLELLTTGTTVLNGEVMDIITMLGLNVDKSSLDVVDNFDCKKNESLDGNSQIEQHYELANNEGFDTMEDTASELLETDHSENEIYWLSDSDDDEQVETVEKQSSLPNPSPGDHGSIDSGRCVEDEKGSLNEVVQGHVKRKRSAKRRRIGTKPQLENTDGNEKSLMSCPLCPKVFKKVNYTAGRPGQEIKRMLRHAISHYQRQLIDRYPFLQDFQASNEDLECPECNRVKNKKYLPQHMVFLHDALNGIWPKQFQDMLKPVKYLQNKSGDQVQVDKSIGIAFKQKRG